MWPILIPLPILTMIGILIFYVVIIIVHKDKPNECRYLELFWEYPFPENASLTYNYNFTNKPNPPYRGDGNMGMGYICFDLYNSNDIKEIKMINHGYTVNSHDCLYLPEEVIKIAIENHENFEKASCEY